MYMRAAELNALRTLVYVFVMAHIDPSARKPKQPDPYPLPGNRTRNPQKPKPGSFLAVASQMIAATREAKKRRAEQWQEEQAAEKSDGSRSESSPTSTVSDERSSES